MHYYKNNVVFFILVNVVGHVLSLVELPAVEDNDIGNTEIVIRNTINNLFAAIKIRDVKQKPKLKQFSIIHNFFVSLTMIDCDSLKEIARLSRVNNIDNNTQHFIAQINELLNEGDKSNQETDGIHVTTYTDAFITKLKFLKEHYGYNKNLQNLNLNEDVLNILKNDGNTFDNLTVEVQANNSDDSVLSHEEVWQPSGRRIFGAHRTRIKFFPFMATIQFFKKFQCAGSIIRKDLVITAASCLQLAWNNRFFRENPAFLSVQIGCDYYESGGENIPVLEIHFHPDYDPKYLRDNLAVLRLSTHIMFSKKLGKVKRIQMDDKASPLPVNINGIVTLGWGARNRNNVVYNPWYNRLGFVELDYYPLSDCQDVYSREYVSAKNFCAGFLSKGGGACSHDVGGPGVSAGILIGVISFGAPICGTVDAPTVFTKVGFYRKWINTIMDQELPEISRLSTKLIPRSTFALHFSDQTKRHFDVSPVERYNEIPEYTQIPVGGNRPDVRILQDDKLFKEFMLTMFGSKEVKNELMSMTETVITSNRKSIRKKHKKPETTKLTTPSNTPSSYETEERTKRSEDETSEMASEDKAEQIKSTPLTTATHTNHRQGTGNKLEDNEELKLQNDIASLLDDLDIYKLLDTKELISINDEGTNPFKRAKEDDKLVGIKTTVANQIRKALIKKDIDSEETEVMEHIQLKEKKVNEDNRSTYIEKSAETTSLDYDFDETLTKEYEEIKTEVYDEENYSALVARLAESDNLEKKISSENSHSVDIKVDKKKLKNKHHKSRKIKTKDENELYELKQKYGESPEKDSESMQIRERRDKKSFKIKKHKKRAKKVNNKFYDMETEVDNKSVKMKDRKKKKQHKVKRNKKTTVSSSSDNDEVYSGNSASAKNNSGDELSIALDLSNTS